MDTTSATSAEMGRLVARWLDEGLITGEQAARMQAERAPSAGLPAAEYVPWAPPTMSRPTAEAPGGGTSLVVEALGYLGGVIILVASILVVARFWSDLATAGRLVIVGAAAALLLAAGALVPARLGDTGQRLRAVLWLTATAAIAGFVGLLGDQALGLTEESLGLLIAGSTAVVAVVLWALHHHPLQHAAAFVSLLATVAILATFLPAEDTGAPGLAAWGLAVIWALLSWGGVLAWAGPPGSANLGVVLGAIGAIFGAMTTMPMSWGIVLALCTITAVVVAAVGFRSLALLVVGSLGALETLPAAMVQWFGGTLGAALGLLAVGVLLVGAAILTARRRQQQPLPGAMPGTRTWLPWPERTAALGASAVVGVGTTIAAVTLR